MTALVNFGGPRRTNETSKKRCSSSRTSGLEEDRISQLPDEILLLILSRLEVDQRARTSVLGHRWKHLWRYNKSLSFVFEGALSYRLDESVYATLCDKFLHRINCVMKSLLVASIEDFSVVFSSDSRYQLYIDACLRLALQKRVKHLKFDLWYSCWGDMPYSFTAESISYYRLDSITSLHLCRVDVTDDFLQYLLSACPLLEELSVKCITLLRQVTVSGPALKLKRLLADCSLKLKSFSVSDLNNLQSLKCNDPIHTLFIKNTPQLTQLRLSYFYKYEDIEKAAQILSRLPLLQTLSLRELSLEGLRSFPVFPKLMNLKKLKLEVDSTGCFSLGLCACLLEASPYLAELKLKFTIQYQFLEDSSNDEKEVKRLDSPLRYLEVVEIIGFVGSRLDMGVALYIIDNTKYIKKMIISTCNPITRLETASNKQEEARIIAREHLGARLPLETQLTVD